MTDPRGPDGDAPADLPWLWLRYEGQSASACHDPEPDDMENLPPGAMFAVSTSWIVVGRLQDADVKIFSGWVARHHARLRRTTKGIAVEDLGSTNGTRVNGVNVKQATLHVGDRVAFAQYNFVVWSAPEE